VKVLVLVVAVVEPQSDIETGPRNVMVAEVVDTVPEEVRLRGAVDEPEVLLEVVEAACVKDDIPARYRQAQVVSVQLQKVVVLVVHEMLRPRTVRGLELLTLHEPVKRKAVVGVSVFERDLVGTAVKGASAEVAVLDVFVVATIGTACNIGLPAETGLRFTRSSRFYHSSSLSRFCRVSREGCVGQHDHNHGEEERREGSFHGCSCVFVCCCF